MKKTRVYHFHNGSGGGVLSVIRNLLAYRQHPEIENHVIYTINREQMPNYKLPGLEGAASEQIFYYSPKWNFYYTCRQLAKLLPDEKAVIVAHDWLELGMVSNLGMQNPVVQVLHGGYDYYYNLALLHRRNVDQYICVSPVIERKLRIRMPEANISFLRFPVPDIITELPHYSKVRVAYVVRNLLEEGKQMKILPLIEKELCKRGVFVEWHLAGGGITREQLVEAWGEAYSDRVFYYGELDRSGIDVLLRKTNIFILPSLFEGFPVAVVEAMKYGLVPLVSYWNGAVADLVINCKTGFTFETQDAGAYAKCIEDLAKNREMMQQLSANAKQMANALFNPKTNTAAYEKIFLEIASHPKKKLSFKAYGSRLDQSFFPNCIVNFIRAL